MYDPARDLFTAGEEAPDSTTEQTLGMGEDLKLTTPNGHAGQKPIHLPTESEATHQEGDLSSAAAKSTTIGVTASTIHDTSGRRRSSQTEETSTIKMGEKRKRSSASSQLADLKNGDQPSTSAPTSRRLSPDHAVAQDDHAEAVKKRRVTAPKAKADHYESPVPMTSSNLPRFSRKRVSATKQSSLSTSGTRDPHRTSRSPPSRRAAEARSADRRHRERSPIRRRSPPRRRSPSSPPRQRTPSPPPRSPPRKLKRPGGGARISQADKDAIRQRQLEREREATRVAQETAANRGVHDVVTQHYNSVPERGRDWRKTDSKIRGLRSLNNWVKSTVIQKFSPDESFSTSNVGSGEQRWAEGMDQGGAAPSSMLKVLDLGCGKGGDLGKWQQAPQPVELYVGVDPADVSIDQARERYRQSQRGGGAWRGGRGGPRGGGGGRGQKNFHAEFFVKDAFGEWLGDIPLIREVGIDGAAGPGAAGAASARWGGGGFDVVSMMFCMHYAFESEAKARGMLKNVSGALKKGGRLIGVIPNSDMLSERVVKFHEESRTRAEPTASTDAKIANSDEIEQTLEWGNSIYRVRFPGKTPEDGIFMPPFGWKYSFFLEEAVEAPEYVVPWEAFRAIAEDYNLEMQYRKPFTSVWKEEKDDPSLGALAERMGVRERGGGALRVSDDEMEAASFYLAFCFYKV